MTKCLKSSIINNKKLKVIPIELISEVHSRRYLLQEVAIEIFTKSSKVRFKYRYINKK
jgi:hypothetical protein